MDGAALANTTPEKERMSRHEENALHFLIFYINNIIHFIYI